MISLNVKAENRNFLNSQITGFYNGLIENLHYIICNKIGSSVKPINPKEFLNFGEVNDFVDKIYINNKHRKNNNVEIEKIKGSINNSIVALSINETKQISDRFSNLIDKYSDNFQSEFNKVVFRLSKNESNSINNFKQALYNVLVEKIENDFKLQKLPENYQLKTNDQNIEAR